MSIIVVGSIEPRSGRSLIAAAIAYHLGREGRSVTLVRLEGDESADADARSFTALSGIASPGVPWSIDQLRKLKGDAVVEASPGALTAVAIKDCSAVQVAADRPRPFDAAAAKLLGTVLTRIPAGEVDAARQHPGVIAVIPEDRLLAAPSIADIAGAIDAQWLAGEEDGQSVDRVMIGTVASDAAEPYFANRERTCVITRFDKTDIQLAALQTEVTCLVITSGGTPSPYLLDRVQSCRDGVAVLAAAGSTTETVRAIEPLFARSRFEGDAKLAHVVSLLDAAGFALDL